MKAKVSILVVSLVMASVFVSGGYGFWEKELTIKGDITVVPDVKTVIPPVNPTVPNANNVEVNANPMDTQSSEQTSGAVEIVNTNTANPEQSKEQVTNNNIGETTKQEEATNATEQIVGNKASEDIVPSEPAKEMEQITHTEAPTYEVNAPSQITDVSKPTETKDVISTPQSDVGDIK